MSWVTVLEYVSTALVIIGAVAVAIPKRWAFYVFIASQIGWATFAWQVEQYGLFGQSLFMFCVNIKAISNWRKKGVGA